MKTLPIFPKLPTGLPEEELRQEIRRRLAIAEQLGLIKRRKQSCRKLTKVDTSGKSSDATPPPKPFLVICCASRMSAFKR